MTYAPRKHERKLRWKLIIPVIALFMLVSYVLINAISPMNGKGQKKFSVCNISEAETVSKLDRPSADVFTLNDFMFYGESLNLYEEMYSPTNSDNLAGKSIELHNVCTDETISMIIQGDIDQHISLEDLAPGFYDISVLDHQIKKRLVFKDVVTENAFTTVQRDDKIKKVQLVANKDLLKDQNVHWDENYLFLQVDEEEPIKGDIDVLIDPYGMNMDITTNPDEGNSANDLIESTEMFYAAQGMKKELESYGLRVAISKKAANDSGKAYGKDGRLAKGYDENARYYLMLRFSKDANKDIRGMELQHSKYASSSLAKTVAYELEKSINMPLCGMYSSETAGIVQPQLVEGVDGLTIYDGNLYLRESGGRATLAGKYSENSKTENATFVDKNGMQGLEIDFIYVTNEEDAKLWKDKKDTIIKETARAFAEGINVIDSK